MQSNNPVFARSEGFQARGPVGYGDPSTWGTGAPGDGLSPEGYGAGPVQTAERMTIDSVVQKTALTIGITIVSAMLTWFWIGDISEAAVSKLMMASAVGAGLAFVLSMVNSFKRVISPALVIAFAAAEGVALGAISAFFNAQYPGIVMQAVLGTFAAFAGTLAAYKFFDIKVSGKFKMFVVAAMFGMVGLGLLEMVLNMFGNGMGLFETANADGSFPWMGLLFSAAGLLLGVFMLIMDFDFVEQGIANGLEARESWRAAFAMTVSLVWIYTNLLRLLAIFSND